MSVVCLGNLSLWYYVGSKLKPVFLKCICQIQKIIWVRTIELVFFSVFKYFEILLFTKRRLIRQKNCVGYWVRNLDQNCNSPEAALRINLRNFSLYLDDNTNYWCCYEWSNHPGFKQAIVLTILSPNGN